MSKNPFFTSKALSKYLAISIGTLQSVGFVIDLEYYLPIILSFKNKDLILTPDLLLDYGLVHQLVFSYPNQVNNFGRKVALGLIQGFKMNKKYADAIIISKAPVWVSNGSLLPAQHNISLHY